jgi:sulfate adenylyltransferase
MRTTSSTTGVCIFLTGLSGAGKSTIATALDNAIRTTLKRAVTLLDGDVVRTHLSKELGFSRTDRDTNIERIAFVASEVVKHGGIVISAAIAPYDAARAAARRCIEANGRFVLVHLSTPLAVCETRDTKGLYAKARRGEIEMFTGVTDAYELPSRAELTIDTSTSSIDDAVAMLLATITKDDA